MTNSHRYYGANQLLAATVAAITGAVQTMLGGVAEANRRRRIHVAPVMVLAALGDAAAATATDYKALVCIFLYGGNDHANTVVPYDSASHAAYAGMRPALAYARSALAPTVLVPTVALPGAMQYALAPELAPLLPLFNSQQLAVIPQRGHAGATHHQAAVPGALGALAAQAVLAQRPAVGVAVVRARGRHVRLGWAHGRPVCRGQWQCHLHLCQCVGQCGVRVGPLRGAVPGVAARAGGAGLCAARCRAGAFTARPR